MLTMHNRKRLVMPGGAVKDAVKLKESSLLPHHLVWKQFGVGPAKLI